MDKGSYRVACPQLKITNHDAIRSTSLTNIYMLRHTQTSLWKTDSKVSLSHALIELKFFQATKSSVSFKKIYRLWQFVQRCDCEGTLQKSRLWTKRSVHLVTIGAYKLCFFTHSNWSVTHERMDLPIDGQTDGLTEVQSNWNSLKISFWSCAW